MKVLNAIVCTDINGAIRFQGMPLFHKYPFVKSLLDFFTTGSTKITQLSPGAITVSDDKWQYGFDTAYQALKEALNFANDEIWIMGEGSEIEELIPQCQNLVVIEVHETAVKSDEKFSFDYSKWKRVLKKECVSGGHQIGVYFFKNPAESKAA